MMTHLAAQLDTSGNIEISEIDAAPLDFSYWSGEYSYVDPLFGMPTERDYKIDIVRLYALKDYIKRCRRRQQTITDAIQCIVHSVGWIRKKDIYMLPNMPPNKAWTPAAYAGAGVVGLPPVGTAGARPSGSQALFVA